MINDPSTSDATTSDIRSEVEMMFMREWYASRNRHGLRCLHVGTKDHVAKIKGAAKQIVCDAGLDATNLAFGMSQTGEGEFEMRMMASNLARVKSSIVDRAMERYVNEAPHTPQTAHSTVRQGVTSQP